MNDKNIKDLPGLFESWIHTGIQGHNISINGKLKKDSIIYFVKSHLPGFLFMPSIVIHCTQHNAAYRLS